MANIYAYDAVAIAADVLPNHRMRSANYNHVPHLTEEKVKKGNLFLRLTIRQMHELALRYMQWQHKIEGVGLSRTPV